MKVKATENTEPNQVATADVKVTLLDENDNSPEFTSNRYSGKVYSNQTEGMVLLKVRSS